MIEEIVLKILVIFLMIAIGYAARKFRLLKENAASTLSDLLFGIAIPCMVLDTMQQNDFEGQIVNDTFWSLLVYVVVTLLLCALSFPVAKLFRAEGDEEGIFRFQIAFTNFGFMGIPLTKAMFGGYCELINLIMNIGFNLVVYTVGIVVMIYQKGDKFFDRRMLGRMLNLTLISCVAGLIIFITGFRFPSFINEGLGYVGDTVVPVAMIIIGMQLQGSNIRRLLSRRNLFLCVISLILVPAFTLGVCLLLPVSSSVAITMAFGMAMPSAAITVILAEQFDRNVLLASEGVAVTTFFSMMTLPVWAIILSYTLL